MHKAAWEQLASLPDPTCDSLEFPADPRALRGALALLGLLAGVPPWNMLA